MSDGDPERPAGAARPLDPARWQRVDDLFARALELPAGEVPRFLAAACGDDRALADEVAALLAHARTDSVRLRSAIALAAGTLASELSSAGVGRRFGPYRALAVLGEGGMGTVYLGERDDASFRRKVAIKVLGPGLASARAIARLRDERQILAELDHPAIVRLLDGGTTDDGLPYLVMEHVEGTPLLDAVARRSIRERVVLVRRLCGALAYAHARLVVHRDLKPGNVLVAADGTPRLLDFGIAKLLAPSAAREAKTGTGEGPMTVEYASPEQIRREPITVASDLFSLGAVLYHVLTGRSPFAGATLAESARNVVELDPPPPSTVVADRAIGADLDRIVLKALRKAPAERHGSAEQLADELDRFLDGRPGREGTQVDRAGRFARRHAGTLALALAATVGAALTAATVLSVRQARRADAEAARARHRFEQVRSLATSLLYDVDGKLQNVPGATPARRVIVERALAYLDSVAGDADEPALVRELAAAYLRVGDLQGNELGPSLGRPADGLVSYQKGLALLDGLVDDDLATRRLRAAALLGRGVLTDLAGDPTRARASILEALAYRRTLPETGAFDVTLFQAYVSLIALERERGEMPLALAHADELVTAARGWVAHDGSADARYALGGAFEAKSQVLARSARSDDACVAAAAAIDLFTALDRDAPLDPRFARELDRERERLAAAVAGCRP